MECCKVLILTRVNCQNNSYHAYSELTLTLGEFLAPEECLVRVVVGADVADSLLGGPRSFSLTSS